MSKFIKGSHAIYSASLNMNRKKKIFHGSLKVYQKLSLKCSHILSDKNALEVNEYFIPYTIDEVCSNNKILLIDQINDPRNLGSIIRSAAAFNFNILMREACPINETVVHCASGGIEHTKICIIKNTSEIIRKLQKDGFFLIGLDERAPMISKNNINKIVLCIGSESGLSTLIKNSCDLMYSLPTSDFTTLNASVAASIAMYSFFS